MRIKLNFSYKDAVETQEIIKIQDYQFLPTISPLKVPPVVKQRKQTAVINFERQPNVNCFMRDKPKIDRQTKIDNFLDSVIVAVKNQDKQEQLNRSQITHYDLLRQMQ